MESITVSRIESNNTFTVGLSMGCALVKVFINEENITDIQAVIAGPESTPYIGGSFRIKLSLPQDFPQSPPKGMLSFATIHVSSPCRACASPSRWYGLLRCSPLSYRVLFDTHLPSKYFQGGRDLRQYPKARLATIIGLETRAHGHQMPTYRTIP